MKNHIFYKSSAQIASLRWQHRPILGPPCRSRRRRFHGDLNLSRRFIRPHSPGIDFGSDGPTFNPLLLHPPFLSFFFPLSSPPRVVSYSRLSNLRLFPLTRLFRLLFIIVTRYSRRGYPRKYRTSRLAFAKDVSKALLPDSSGPQ